MSKATLKFNLDDPDDAKGFILATTAQRAYSALWEIREYIRNTDKNGKYHLTQGEFYNIMEENGINFDNYI